MTQNRQINCGIFPTIYFRILGLGLGSVALALYVSGLGIGLGLLALALTPLALLTSLMWSNLWFAHHWYRISSLVIKDIMSKAKAKDSSSKAKDIKNFQGQDLFSTQRTQNYFKANLSRTNQNPHRDQTVGWNRKCWGLRNCMQLGYTLVVVYWICSVFVLSFCSIFSFLPLHSLWIKTFYTESKKTNDIFRS